MARWWCLMALLLLGSSVEAKKKKKEPPKPDKLKKDDGMVFGMLIDAGSQGSRLHLFQWRQRSFTKLPPNLTVPLTSEKWSLKVKPGMASFSDPDEAARSLRPLLEYAKLELALYEERWHEFPIYVKATAGMRELADLPRLAIMESVREMMKVESPFALLNDENVRVISGEEEAAYAWISVNYVDGMLEDALNNGNFGTADPRRARGTLEMGGSSSQVAFYKPQHDVVANLFKLQLGSTAHINIYAHSFLHYGHVSARIQMWSSLADAAGCWVEGKPVNCTVVDYCLPEDCVKNAKNEVSGTGVVGLAPPYLYSPHNLEVTIVGGFDKKDKKGSMEKCSDQTEVLFDQKFNMWCYWSHRGQCSFGGVYQPSIPEADDSQFGEFVLLGGYTKLYGELGLRSATLEAMKTLATEDCATQTDLHFLDHDEFCFVAAFAYSMMTTGHHFSENRRFTALQEERYRGGPNLVNLGWPLGAMLYEINALPWTYAGRNDDDAPKKNVFVIDPGPRKSLVGKQSMLVGLLALAAFLLLCVLHETIYIMRRRRHLLYTSVDTPNGHGGSGSSSTNDAV